MWGWFKTNFKFSPRWLPEPKDGFMLMGKVDGNPFTPMGKTLGYFHLEISVWFAKTKVCWAITE